MCKKDRSKLHKIGISQVLNCTKSATLQFFLSSECIILHGIAVLECIILQLLIYLCSEVFMNEKRRFIGSIFDFEIVQQGFVMILGGEAGVTEIAVGVTPILQASVVEES